MNEWNTDTVYTSFVRMHLTLQPHGPQPSGLHCTWNFPGKNTRVGCHFLLQGIFQIQVLNPCLLQWQFLYHRATWEAPY